ncbi:hypothetical protein Y598_6055 [Burkholderia pseudomallei MSHR3335]|nr:hypothetical protein Y598_6055 [Burkholderia pseudomallei MSHR3335]
MISVGPYVLMSRVCAGRIASHCSSLCGDNASPVTLTSRTPSSAAAGRAPARCHSPTSCCQCAAVRWIIVGRAEWPRALPPAPNSSTAGASVAPDDSAGTISSSERSKFSEFCCSTVSPGPSPNQRIASSV